MKASELKRMEQLRTELRELTKKSEAEDLVNEQRKKYEAFKNRKPCAFVGMAHADELVSLGISVGIPGNCGATYTGPAVTRSTRTYFHNIWTDADKRAFAEKLNNMVKDEMLRIMNNPNSRLEILGLQSTEYHLRQLSPADKKKAEADVREEQYKVLDTVDWGKPVGSLSHSRSILEGYNRSRKRRIAIPE